MADGITLSDIGSIFSGASFALLAAWVIRTWPVWKMRINEARKIQLDADGARLAAAFERIRTLEETQSTDRRAFNDAQSADRREFNEALSNERKRCDRELDEIRARLTAAEMENRSLQAMIQQNSRSTAQMIGRPGDVAESRARRGDDDG